MDATFSALAVAQLWQVTTLIVIVALVNHWLSRKRPHLAHVLWLVVLAKCLTPPLWSSTGGVFCWLQQEHRVEPQVTQFDGEWQAVEWQELLVADSAADHWESAGDSSYAGVPLSNAEAADLLEHDAASLDVDWPTALAASWLTSVSVVLFVVAVRWWLFWRRLKRAPRRECPELEAQLAELARQLGVRRIRLLVTESRIGPAVVGLFRKTILLPAIVVDRLAAPVGRIKLCADPAMRGPDVVSTEQLAEQDEGEPCRNGAEPGPAYSSLLPILAHELLHVRRGDLWVGLLQTLAQAVWWFHPLVWWVGRLTNREAERCCDEEVLAELKCDPAAYARSLLDVLELKSQLAPVPVFPGVRPVDVTSQRLERIMTLGQGCRRRTPWWCWLIALGTAALTLPGAAFVVSAQDEAQPAETPSDATPPIPAPQADGSPGPAPPVPVPGFYRVRGQAADDASPETTVVYETAEFAHLLSGTQDEQQQKFEWLVRSRDQAGNAEVKWFNDKPIVRTTNAGHRAVQDCLSFLAETNVTPKQFAEFLGSVAEQPTTAIVIDLQMISLDDDALSDLRTAVGHAVELPDAATTWTLPAATWETLLSAVKQTSIGRAPNDGISGISNPRLAVANGHSVRIERVVAHPADSSAPVQQPTSLPATGSIPWTGWKAQALPFQREDGSFWLGMKLETRSVVDPETRNAQAQDEAQRYRDLDIIFKTTLQDGQIFVLPGFKVSLGDETPRTAILTVQILKLDDPPNWDDWPAPRKVAGNSKTSAATGANEASLSFLRAKPATPTGQNLTKWAEVKVSRDLKLNSDGRALISVGPLMCFASLESDDKLTPETVSRVFNEPVIVTASQSADDKTFSLRADRLAPRPGQPQFPVMLVGNVQLTIPKSGVNATAGSVVVTQSSGSKQLRFEMLDVQFERSIEAGTQFWTAPRATIEVAADNWSDVFTERISSPSPGSSQVVSQPIRLTEFSEKSARRKPFQIQRQIGPVTVSLRQRGDGMSSPKLIVTAESAEGRGVLAGTADSVVVRTQSGTTSIQISRVGLQVPAPAGPHRIEARELTLTLDDVPGDQTSSAIKLKLNDAQVEMGSPRNGSRIKAKRIETLLNVDSLEFEQLNADGLTTLWADPNDVSVAAAYPVADLVVPIPHRVVVHADQESGGKEWKVVDRKDGVVPAAAEGLGKTAYDFDQLIDLIQSVIQPDSWADKGGRARIESNETTLSLVVRQTQQVHEEISDLLAQLRRLQDLQVTLQIQTLEVPESFLADWNVDLQFRELSESKSHRYMRLSPAQAEELRSGSKVTQTPKVTLFNGQLCLWNHTLADESPQKWHLQTVASADRRFVRLGVGIDEIPGKPVSTSVVSIPDREAILVEAIEPADAARVVGVPIPGRPKAFRSVRPPRRFVLIQPEIVIVEEEEELLGIEP